MDGFRPKLLALSFIALAFSCNVALAKTTASKQEPEVFVVPDVVIDGAAVDEAAYARLRKAIDAFGENRQLAPASAPRFLIAPVAGAAAAAKNLALSLETQTGSTDVKIDRSGLFAVPSLTGVESETARLVLNQPKGAYRWTPYVRSPNLPRDHLRFGDLRLECEMRWAFLQDTFDFAKKALLQSIGGPCHSAMVRVHYDSPRPLAAVVLIDGERREALESQRISADGQAFFPPIHQSEWSDDAQLELRFR